MRERSIVWDVIVVGLLFLLVIINGLTLLQNQSIEKRLVKNMEMLAQAGPRVIERTNDDPRTVKTTQDSREHSPSYSRGTEVKHVFGDENADDGDTLTLNEVSEPNSLNYLIDNDATTHDIFEMANDQLAKRVFGFPNEWEPQLAEAWESAMLCRGLCPKKNAKELAAKLNASLTPEQRKKFKISAIDAESDEIVRIQLYDAVGEYREPVVKLLGDDLEPQHWLYCSYEGKKFSDGTEITAASVADRVKKAIQSAPGFNGRFLPNWERDGSVVVMFTGNAEAAEKAVKAMIATDAAKGEVADPKSVTGTTVKQVITYDITEHYAFEEKPIFTFYLRKNARWHDGKPLTGRDVVFSFNTMMNPKVECPQLRNYYLDLESVKLVNDDLHTVQFTWRKPYFLSFANSAEFVIYAEHLYHFADAKEFNENPKNQEMMGNGPYKWESRLPKQQIVLVRNEDYYGKKPHFKHIVIKFISDPTAGLLSLKNGGLDVQSIRKGQMPQVKDDAAFKSKFNIEVSVAPVYRYIGWNIRREKFSSVKTRRALTMLIDRQRIIDKIYYGYAELLDVPNHPQNPSFPTADLDKLRIPFDVDAAKKLLAEDGWSDTDGDHILDKDFNGVRVPFKFTLLIQSTAPEYEAVANQIKNTMAQAGIDVTIRQLEWSVFIQNIERLNFDAMILGWQVTVADDPYQLWHSSQTGEKASNHCGYVNKDVDRWIEEGRKELDTEKRNEIFHKLYAQIAHDQPYTCLFVEKRTVGYDKRIHNVVYNFQTREITKWWVPKELQKVK